MSFGGALESHELDTGCAFDVVTTDKALIGDLHAEPHDLPPPPNFVLAGFPDGSGVLRTLRRPLIVRFQCVTELTHVK